MSPRIARHLRSNVVGYGGGFTGVEVVHSSAGIVFGFGVAASRAGFDGLTFRCGPAGQNGCP